LWQTHALNSRFKDNVGNNILPTLPELDLVFDDPTVRGKCQMEMQIPLALGLIAAHVIPPPQAHCRASWGRST
jgi:hypothetical protein